METKCPVCGYTYDAEATPQLKGGCPKCVANFLKDETEPVDSPGVQSRMVNEPPPFEAGDTYNDMEIIELLGRGGMGFVFKARQTKLNRVVALKILDPRLASAAEFTSRFNREAKALAALNHPNIVQVHDIGHADEYHYLIMEYIDGATLRDVLTADRLEPEAALRYVPQICDALEYAHAAGVIHRDIKPENILIDKQGVLKVADFGLAKMTADELPVSQITVAGQVMGTPNYMAPEQMKAMSTVDHRADIYSLGVVFYEMLTGELPIGRFPAPSESVNVDVRLDEVVLKALATDPERRYQRASEVKDGVSATGSGASAGEEATARGNERMMLHGERADSRSPAAANTWTQNSAIIVGMLLLAAGVTVLFVLFLNMKVPTLHQSPRPGDAAGPAGPADTTGPTLIQGKQLWQGLADAILHPGPYNYSGNLMSPPPKCAPELEQCRKLFSPSITASSGRNKHEYYAYPFTGIQKAHRVLDPTVIPSLLEWSRPTRLDPIKALDGTKLAPDKLRAFLKEARVKLNIDSATAEAVDADTQVSDPTLTVSDGDTSFTVPLVHIEGAGWRLGMCSIVKGVIHAIAARSGAAGPT